MSYRMIGVVMLLAALASLDAHAFSSRDVIVPSRAALGSETQAVDEQKTPEEVFALGTIFDDGVGVPRNYQAALYWYAQAARGSCRSHESHRSHACDGPWCDAGLRARVRVVSGGGKAGFSSAALNVATAYFDGLGVAQSYDQAASGCSYAARGDPRAENKLALLYTEGLGVPRNPEMAIALFRRSAAQGYAPAMAILGGMYAEGIGMERDDVRAQALLQAALGIGLPDGVRESAQHRLDQVAARLSSKSPRLNAAVTANSVPERTR